MSKTSKKKEKIVKSNTDKVKKTIFFYRVGPSHLGHIQHHKRQLMNILWEKYKNHILVFSNSQNFFPTIFEKS